MQIIDFINNLFWGYFLIAALVICALWFTFRTRAVQFGMQREMIHVLKGEDTKTADDAAAKAATTDDTFAEHAPRPKEKRKISSFEAFVVGLASRIGTGNLAGVASAIIVGGPGAVFWMWVMAVFGAATAFVESTLAQLFKVKGKDSFVGGPAYYMERGLKKPWMGALFALLLIFGFAMANQLVQSNTICSAMQGAFGWNASIIGIVLTVVTLLIIFGGIQRIARFSSIVVPVMAVGYILLALTVTIINIKALPGALRLIIDSAFGVRQFAGGGIGATIMMGVKRGLFSNEAGEGSAPNAAATATTSHPVKQGLIQALGVFTDTLIVCSCTAFIILCSGVDINGGAEGIQLTQLALTSQIGPAGGIFVAVAILFFAYSSIIGNYYYGEVNLRFIVRKRSEATRRRSLFIFRLASSGMVMVGALISVSAAWSLIDLSMALLTTCNLVAIVFLGKYAFRLLDDYRAQRKRGISSPTFNKHDIFPDIADDLEGWD